MLGTTTLENVFAKVGQSLEDPSGGTSQRRLFGLLWAVVLAGGVGYLVVKNSTFPELPDSILWITGMVLFSVVAQKPLENATKKEQG